MLGFTVDRRVTILEEGANFRMERHPDGTLCLAVLDKRLYESSDQAQSWTKTPWTWHPNGFSIMEDGRFWMLTPPASVHEAVIGIHQSADRGRSWESCEVDCGPFAAGGAADPYTIIAPDGVEFVERPDGTMMFSCSMRYPDWDGYQQRDQSRPGLREVMLRSSDGGRTWGDSTIVHQHATSTSYAVDPNDPDYILAFARIQRDLLPGETSACAVCGPPGWPAKGWPFKNGVLLTSTDGGRTFAEVEGGMTRCYGHMGTILWTNNDVVVVVRQHGYESMEDREAAGNNGGWIEATISLNGGRTWVDDSAAGTPYLNRAKTFTLVPFPDGHMEQAPTVETSPNHFFTAYAAGVGERGVTDRICAVHWHIELD